MDLLLHRTGANLGVKSRIDVLDVIPEAKNDVFLVVKGLVSGPQFVCAMRGEWGEGYKSAAQTLRSFPLSIRRMAEWYRDGALEWAAEEVGIVCWKNVEDYLRDALRLT